MTEYKERDSLVTHIVSVEDREEGAFMIIFRGDEVEALASAAAFGIQALYQRANIHDFRITSPELSTILSPDKMQQMDLSDSDIPLFFAKPNKEEKPFSIEELIAGGIELFDEKTDQYFLSPGSLKRPEYFVGNFGPADNLNAAALYGFPELERVTQPYAGVSLLTFRDQEICEKVAQALRDARDVRIKALKSDGNFELHTHLKIGDEFAILVKAPPLRVLDNIHAHEERHLLLSNEVRASLQHTATEQILRRSFPVGIDLKSMRLSPDNGVDEGLNSGRVI